MVVIVIYCCSCFGNLAFHNNWRGNWHLYYSFNHIAHSILGTFLVKAQGIYVLKEIQSKFDELKNPTEPIIHGAMILFAGALLLTPGFFTDSVGFLLLIPNVRAITFAWLKSNLKFIKHPPSESQFTREKNYSDIEITDYKEVQPGEPSPWSDRNN